MKNITKKDIAAVLIFVVLIVAFVLLITNINNKSSGRELNIVRDAVKNAALTCYVVEGTYPESVQYLRDNYNLSYNEDKFFVEFREREWFASNVLPEIIVEVKGGENQ